MADSTSFLRGLRGATILGINPPVFDFTCFDLWAKPLGLLFLLDALRRRENTVFLLDCLAEEAGEAISFGRRKLVRSEVPKPTVFKNIPRRYHRFGLDDAAMLRRMRALPRPDCVLVTSGMTYWYEGVFRAVELAKELFPGVPVILGGVYARLCPEHAVRSGADVVQDVPPSIPLVRPAMELYAESGYAVLLTSFGCPLSCEYCASKRLFPKFVVRELSETLADAAFQFSLHGARDAAFYDDALLIDKERRFYPLCEALHSRFPGVRYHTPNGLHIREIDERCAAVLKRTGFQTLRLSLESSDPDVQRKGSGKTSGEEFRRALGDLRRAGFTSEQMETYILAGLPGQTTSSVVDSILFAESCGARAKLAEFSPVPGTPSFEEAAAAIPQLREEPLLHNKTAYTSFISGAILPEELQRLKDLTKHR